MPRLRHILALLLTLWLPGALALEADYPLERFTPERAPLARLLWLPSEHGVQPAERVVARALARRGIEVWLPDLFAAHFLPPLPSSLGQIPLDDVLELLRAASADGRPLVVLSADQGARLAVQALHHYTQQPRRRLGLILLNPNLYTRTPEPGQPARYWPETEALNLPVFILQAELSPWRWRLAELTERLRRGGSPVYTWLLRGVRDRYYFRPDALPAERAEARRLPQRLLTALYLLGFHMDRAYRSPPLRKGGQTAATHSAPGRGRGLQPYHGPQGLALDLPDLTGRRHRLRDYRGRVVLVNFWASWCPPCVHEIPSMVRLKRQLAGRPFEILAVNLGEPRAAIESFLRDHPVNFPVLLDESGRAVREWRVFAYPSSYLIDADGRIRYALFGGHEWDEPDTLRRIRALLPDHAPPAQP